MHCSFVQSNNILISSILVIIIIGLFTRLAYNNQSTALQNSVNLGLESTASVMATQLSPKDLAGLKHGDDGSEQYKAVVQKLRTMRSMDDTLLNVYILKVNPDQSVTLRGDELYLEDPQGSAKIGEVSTDPEKMDILLTLSGPTTSKQPFTTKYGSFMTAYVPIDDSIFDSTLNTYVVLAIDVPATDYNDYTSRGGLILLTGLISMNLAVGAIFWFGRSVTKKDN